MGEMNYDLIFEVGELGSEIDLNDDYKLHEITETLLSMKVLSP